MVAETQRQDPIDLRLATVDWLNSYLSKLRFAEIVHRNEKEALCWFVGEAIGCAWPRAVRLHDPTGSAHKASLVVELTESLSSEDVQRIMRVRFALREAILCFGSISAQTELIGYDTTERFLEIRFVAAQ